MIDLHEFGRRLTDRLLTIAAENRGENRIESVRRYHTDATFHAMVDTIVLTACAVVRDMEEVPVDERAKYLDSMFRSEADGLLS
jgi:hypothetical protein